MGNSIDLNAPDDMAMVEELPEVQALGSWFTAASASSASCPASSAACLGTASTLG
jgi:hypothetical protein